jgi:hypothetical protein
VAETVWITRRIFADENGILSRKSWIRKKSAVRPPEIASPNIAQFDLIICAHGRLAGRAPVSCFFE